MSLWNSDSVADCAFLSCNACCKRSTDKLSLHPLPLISLPHVSFFCALLFLSHHPSFSCMSLDEALLIVEVCDCNKLWQLTMQACTELGGESHATNPWGQQSPNHPSCMGAQPPRSLTIPQNAYSDITQTWAVSRWLLHSTDITSPTFNDSDIHYFDFMDIQR